NAQLGPADKRNLRELSFNLGLMSETVGELGFDPRVLFFHQQLTYFVSKNSQQAYYLSYIMQNLDVMRLFRRKPEYVRLKNLFTNPYDSDVEIAFPYGRIEHASLSEMLFSLIPG